MLGHEAAWGSHQLVKWAKAYGMRTVRCSWTQTARLSLCAGSFGGVGSLSVNKSLPLHGRFGSRKVLDAMPRKAKVNHGQRCVGVWRSSVKCKRSKDGGGIWLNKACEKCKEWRCKTHCRCGRRKAAVAASSSSASASSTQRTVAATSHATAAPVGRPAALGIMMLSIRAWWHQLVQDVGSAGDLLISSYMYDHKALHEALKKQLQAGCKVCILIDKSSFDSGKPYAQRSRLAALENVWDILKHRLAETMPKTLETRDAFIKRLKKEVAWVNRNKAERLWYLSTNQKKRADECLATKPPGGRTSW